MVPPLSKTGGNLTPPLAFLFIYHGWRLTLIREISNYTNMDVTAHFQKANEYISKN